MARFSVEGCTLARPALCSGGLALKVVSAAPRRTFGVLIASSCIMFRVTTQNLLMWITYVLCNRKIRVYDLSPPPPPCAIWTVSLFFTFVIPLWQLYSKRNKMLSTLLVYVTSLMRRVWTSQRHLHVCGMKYIKGNVYSCNYVQNLVLSVTDFLNTCCFVSHIV